MSKTREVNDTFTISAALVIGFSVLVMSLRSCAVSSDVRDAEKKKGEHAVITACVQAGNPPHECERLVK